MRFFHHRNPASGSKERTPMRLFPISPDTPGRIALDRRRRRRPRIWVEWLEDRTLLSGTAGDVITGMAIPIALGTPIFGTLAPDGIAVYQINASASGRLVAQVHAGAGGATT